MKTIWDKYHYDRQVIEEFLNAFIIKVKRHNVPINWKNTISKILVWDGFNFNFQYDYSTLILSRKSSLVKSIAKYGLHIFSLKKKSGSKTKSINDINCEVLFFLKNKGEIEVILPLLEKLKPRTSFFLVYEHDDTEKKFDQWELIKLSEFDVKPNKTSLRLKKNPSSRALYVFNAFIREKINIDTYIGFFTKLKQTNPNLKKIVFVAGENKYVSNLCHELFKETSVRTENLMNGAKIGWVHDADVDFDTWYVWNDKMKQFLNESAKVPAKVLSVVGHPLQDQFKSHQYSEINHALNQFKGEFDVIISLFSTSRVFEKKNPIYNLIINFVKQNPHLGLIIKAHPSDKEISFFDAFKRHSQICFIDGFSKQLLLDIIKSSNVTLSFSSTVSFESVWMGVPNISYEESEDTLLPIEDELFYHINKTEDILPKIQTLLNNDIPKKQNTSQISVVDKYVECILS